jgi:hypothetical protein
MIRTAFSLDNYFDKIFTIRYTMELVNIKFIVLRRTINFLFQMSHEDLESRKLKLESWLKQNHLSVQIVGQRIVIQVGFTKWFYL